MGSGWKDGVPESDGDLIWMVSNLTTSVRFLPTLLLTTCYCMILSLILMSLMILL